MYTGDPVKVCKVCPHRQKNSRYGPVHNKESNTLTRNNDIVALQNLKSSHSPLPSGAKVLTETITPGGISSSVPWGEGW